MNILEREYFNLTVVRAPLTEIVEVFDNYSTMRLKAVNTPFIFPSQPYRADSAKVPMLLWSPSATSDLTAFMPSVSSGDYFFTSYCAQFKFDVIAFRSTSESAKNQVNEFVAYENGLQIRIVQALQDSPRWVFFQYGEPLPFEAVEQYQSRFIRNRLKRENVITYAQAWGAPVSAPKFWEAQGDSYTFVRKDG